MTERLQFPASRRVPSRAVRQAVRQSAPPPYPIFRRTLGDKLHDLAMKSPQSISAIERIVDFLLAQEG